MSVQVDDSRTLKTTDGSLLTLILITAVLYFGREVFIPLALAGLLAFLLAPLASFLERWHIPRAVSSLTVVTVAMAGVIALSFLVLNQIYNLAIELPMYQGNITQKVSSVHLDSADKLSETVAMISRVSRQIRTGTITPPTVNSSPAPRRRTASRPNAPTTNTLPSSEASGKPVTVRLDAPEESFLTIAESAILPLVHPLTTTFIVVVFLVFMLIGRDDLRERALRLFGRGRFHVTSTAIEDASQRVRRYLLMQLLVNFVYGTLVGLFLWRIGIPNPLLWGILVCVLRFVPYIGILMAAAGPIFLSIAVSPHWTLLLWTIALFVVLEVLVANVIEPLLYGSSTGISALAILVTAIFWTVLWGLPGLLLSTPLTVVMVVIGRQVPRLRYLDVLFGEETAAPPAERFYQRILASHFDGASALLKEHLKTSPAARVYDEAIIPTLALIEETRQNAEITSVRADEMLHAIEDITEDVHQPPSDNVDHRPMHVVCIPARGLADEVACQLASHVLQDIALVSVIPPEELSQYRETVRFDVACVIGIPPRATRHIRMRCHQIHLHSPETIVVACQLDCGGNLTALRSRIPLEDSQHVVCSLQLMRDYLTSLDDPSRAMLELSSPREDEPPHTEATTGIALPQELLDAPDEALFPNLAVEAARAFDAPIVLILSSTDPPQVWETTCGLPEESHNFIGRHTLLTDSTLVIPDIAADPRLARDPFLAEKGIRFYAGTPLKTADGASIGSLAVLDTRPRTFNDQQTKTLVFLANSIATAIELHPYAESEKAAEESIPTVEHHSP